MSELQNIDIVVIGGSAGSFNILMSIIKAIDNSFSIPIVIVIHRQKNVLSDLTKILGNANPNKKIVEPDDKDYLKKNYIYVAPQNYHLLIEKDNTFSLDYSEAVQFSRPSIDVTFESVALQYQSKALAILLSGANKDGTEGLKKIVAKGGIAIVQNPTTADYPVMPASAIKTVENVKVFTPDEMAIFLNKLKQRETRE